MANGSGGEVIAATQIVANGARSGPGRSCNDICREGGLLNDKKTSPGFGEYWAG